MQDRTCTIDGCDKPHRARGLCASHWNATYRKDQHREVPCTICGTLVIKNAPGRKRRPVCSERCRYRVTHGRWPETGKELVGPVERRRVPPQVKPTTQPAKVRFVATICGWCAAPFLHDMRITGTLGRYCVQRCADAAARHRRREKRGQFTITRMRRLAIYQRDGWMCQLCGSPVEQDLPLHHPMQASLDHIECQSWALIPDHRDSNLRLAHLRCNGMRSDRDEYYVA